ncbi:MAG: hypothetical protein JXA21_27160 [Anaerolineae bacterium]|nr:hypothetical protein [Anaerolineae bacterium]
MAEIGYGYGSEWHLLRHLGYHRAYLSRKVIDVVGAQGVEWLDFNFSPKNAPLQDDKERVGLEFIEDAQIQEKWKSFWPQTGNAQNWDAVGRIYFGDTAEWLLVEAKGHIGELERKCGATSRASKHVIHSAFEKTSRAFGNRQQPIQNWLAPYYQYANRLAVLYFLMRECSPPVNARLLFIYFYGENRDNLNCPQDEQAWLPEIEKMKSWLGIDRHSELAQRIHYLFLPVNPDGVGVRVKSKG